MATMICSWAPQIPSGGNHECFGACLSRGRLEARRRWRGFVSKMADYTTGATLFVEEE
jgi:hypothetical protein